MSAAPPLVVILVATAGPLNLGAVARLCANFAVRQLRLVAPRCDPHDPQALRMAVHARDILRNAPVFPHLDAALQDCGRVAACSARLAPEPLPTAAPEQVMPWLLQPHPLPAALVCGREDHGLHNTAAVARMAKLEGILRRAEPGPGELALLRGMVRQLRWAVRHGPKTTPQPQP